MPKPGRVLLVALADYEKTPLHVWLGRARLDQRIGNKALHIEGQRLAEKLGNEASQRIISAYLRKINVDAEAIRLPTTCQLTA